MAHNTVAMVLTALRVQAMQCNAMPACSQHLSNGSGSKQPGDRAFSKALMKKTVCTHANMTGD